MPLVMVFGGRVCHMIREEVYSISGSLPLSIFSQIASRCLNSDLVILNGFVFKSEYQTVSVSNYLTSPPTESPTTESPTSVTNNTVVETPIGYCPIDFLSD